MQNPNVDQRLHDIFCQYGVMKTFNTGQFLVEKGQPAAYSCYITSGYARTLCCNSDGNEIVLFYIEPNNMICSEALLLDAIVNVSVQAISTGEMYMIPGEKLLHLWTARGYGVQELIRPLVTRLTLLSDYICCAHFQDSSKKVAYFLYSCYMRLGPMIPYSNEQIANITGINRASVNRTLNALSKAGIVEPGYKQVKVLKVRELSEIFDMVGYFIDK